MKRMAGMARGAFALGAAGAFSKVLGAAQRLLVARWLGAETMGLWELALPVLGAGTNLVALGVPVGLTVWVPAALARSDGAGAVRLRRAADWLLALSAGGGAIALLLVAPALARLLGDPDAAAILRVLAPGLALGVVLAGRRAWLTALGRLQRVAASNAVEQTVRVAAALLLAWLMAGTASPRAAAALAVAPSAGAAAALLVLGGASRARGERPTVADVRRLLGTGIPSWAATTVVGAMAAVDPGIILWQLRAGGRAVGPATALLGELLGMAMPLATACLVFYGAIGSALLPAVAAAWSERDLDRLRAQLRQSYFWAAAIGLPMAASLSVLARPLCALLYHDAAAGLPLTVAAWVAVPLGFSTIAATALTGMGAPQAQLPPLLLGTAVRTALILLLTVPLGTVGVAWAAVAGWCVTAAGNVVAAARRCGTAPELRPLLLGPAVAAVLAFVVARWAFAFGTGHGLGEGAATVLAVPTAVAVAAAWLLPRLFATSLPH